MSLLCDFEGKFCLAPKRIVLYFHTAVQGWSALFLISWLEPNLTCKYWLLEYLLSWPSVLSSRCCRRSWVETMHGICSLQLKIVLGCLAAKLFLSCWWPGLEAENVWVGFIMLWPLNFKLLLMVDVKSPLSQFQAQCKIPEFLARHFPCQQFVTSLGFWGQEVAGLFTEPGSSKLVEDLCVISWVAGPTSRLWRAEPCRPGTAVVCNRGVCGGACVQALSCDSDWAALLLPLSLPDLSIFGAEIQCYSIELFRASYFIFVHVS